jgi:hypothetical protein
MQQVDAEPEGEPGAGDQGADQQGGPTHPIQGITHGNAHKLFL